LSEKYAYGEDLLPPRRKGAKKSLKNAAALCALAPLRERKTEKEDFSGKADLTI
jgi:hypothetical protein